MNTKQQGTALRNSYIVSGNRGQKLPVKKENKYFGEEIFLRTRTEACIKSIVIPGKEKPSYEKSSINSKLYVESFENGIQLEI